MRVPNFNLGSSDFNISHINVQKDILKLNFVLTSHYPVEDLKYSVSLTEWNEHHLKIFLNFTDPLVIS